MRQREVDTHDLRLVAEQPREQACRESDAAAHVEHPGAAIYRKLTKQPLQLGLDETRKPLQLRCIGTVGRIIQWSRRSHATARTPGSDSADRSAGCRRTCELLRATG